MNEVQIIEIARKNGIEIKPESLQRNESGLDFLVVFAEDVQGEQWALRFPRRDDVLSTTVKEKRTLDLIAPHIRVQVPRWEVFTNECIAYKKLQGVPAGTIDVEAKAYVWELDIENIPDEFHQSHAEGLVSLHKIDCSHAEIPDFKMLTASEVRSVMKERMERVKEKFAVNSSLWDRWQAWLTDDELWPKQTALIHGDLHAGHILMDEKCHVTGYIDWTEASVADPAKDFLPHLMTFGEDALNKLIHYYGEAGGYVWPKLKQHVIELGSAYPIDIAEFALKSGLEEYMEMAKQSLK